jgi:hypothetical protein
MNDETDFNATDEIAHRMLQLIGNMVIEIEETKDKGNYRCRFEKLKFPNKELMWLFVCNDEMAKFFQQVMKDTQEKAAIKK